MISAAEAAAGPAAANQEALRTEFPFILPRGSGGRTPTLTQLDLRVSYAKQFGKTLRAVYSNRDGIVIGRTEAPLVNSGDAVVHIAS